MYYTSHIPALPPVADPVDRERLRMAEAPVVVAWTLLDDELLSAAIREHELRKVLCLYGNVTKKEVRLTYLREFVLMMEHAATEYPPAVKPE